jgi:hypothetical protein
VARAWAWVIGTVVVAAIVGVAVWEIRDQISSSRANGNSMGEAALSMIRGQVLAPWQQDVLDSLEASAQRVGSAEISQAEIAVDRAASILTAARLKSQHSDPEFFQLAVTGLDRIWSQRPADDRLFEHVTQARIELAMLRVAQNGIPAGSKATSIAPSGNDPDWIPAVKANGKSSSAAEIAAVRGHVAIRAPRTIAANSVLNPAALGGDYLDATQMPETAEILLTPSQEGFEANVRVENLTIAGASQTLDSIRWANVTFVGTRLRYGKGPLDLENVHFVGCTFGFPTDENGSRLANAIALGQTSFTAE